MPQRTIDKSLNHLSTDLICQTHLGNTKFTSPKCQVMSHLCEKNMFHLHQYNLGELMGHIRNHVWFRGENSTKKTLSVDILKNWSKFELLDLNCLSSWWFQPIWNIWVKMGSSSLIFGVKIKNIWNDHLPVVMCFWRRQGKYLLPSRSLTARPWKMMGLEDDPLLLGPGLFSGANC